MISFPGSHNGLCPMIGFHIQFRDGSILDESAFNPLPYISLDNTFEYIGYSAGNHITWRFEPRGHGYLVSLHISGCTSRPVISLSPVDLLYEPTDNTDNYRVLQCSEDIIFKPLGFPTLREALANPVPGTLMTGLFSFDKPGIFIGTLLPQKHRNIFSLGSVDSAVRIAASTTYTSHFGSLDELSSESVWVCTGLTARKSFKEYADLYPIDKKLAPAYGWNSWDYYFPTVSHKDIVENVDRIFADDKLKRAVRYIVIDDGWQHQWGEWVENYKFPGGLRQTAAYIALKGFIPGIWTAPLCVDQLTTTALRHPEILVKDAYGDPVSVEGQYLVDPTSPAGEAFLAALFSRLYADGFRLFKVDFVRRLMDVDAFYDRNATPYDAARRLFAIVRRCAGEGSHILGCSLPIECGPGIAESGRTGIDIHNQWTHVLWAVESYTFTCWANRRIWVNDADFLVVRGSETSVETETNVMNPAANNPDPQGFYKRWRRGPVFNRVEAETWANFVAMTGGNIFSSDRIAMLNEYGMELTRFCLASVGNAAEPLDLCRDAHCAFWLREEESFYRLLAINWKDEPDELAFCFDEYDMAPPAGEVTVSTRPAACTGSTMLFQLPAHGSVLCRWAKQDSG